MPAGATPLGLPDGVVPTKVIGVHLNYRSRAAQRGRTPTEPSYFLKPVSSLSPGGSVIRPAGVQLLAYEGEIALIIGARTRHVTPEQAAERIGFYAPANDLGAHDFRWADRGSGVLAKGQDGFTPIGPAMAAAGVDPADLRLRTRVNGELRQDSTPADLIFSFAQLIADLTRFMTLERGDVILTGTPAGTGVVSPGDTVEVELVGAGEVVSTVVEASAPLAAYGAMPRATEEARAFATGAHPVAPGGPAPAAHAAHPAPISPDAHTALRQVSTATLTTQLTRRGIRTTFLSGLRPSRPDLRMVGVARTLRYVALRADVRASLQGTEDAQKRAVETIAPGEVLVMEARGETGAGTIGDILAARVLARRGAGIVTDGGMRDTPGVARLDISTYFKAANASSLWSAHIPLDTDVPITCAGVLVMPGDVLVGDADGVVVLPAADAEEIAHDAIEQEHREAWALQRVAAGESIRGVYPLSPDRQDEYERWRQAQEPSP